MGSKLVIVEVIVEVLCICICALLRLVIAGSLVSCIMLRYRCNSLNAVRESLTLVTAIFP